MRTRVEGLRRVESEITREKAAALGRAGERLEAALRSHRMVDQQFPEPAPPSWL